MTSRHVSQLIFGLSCIAGVFLSVPFTQAGDPEEAYALNQDAMVDMSMAQFDSAAEKFIRAADIAPDYSIKNRALRYTPNFMAAWAFEKTGKLPHACQYFKRFLEVSPPEEREQTKADHAEKYINRRCH